MFRNRALAWILQQVKIAVCLPIGWVLLLQCLVVRGSRTRAAQGMWQHGVIIPLRTPWEWAFLLGWGVMRGWCTLRTAQGEAWTGVLFASGALLLMVTAGVVIYALWHGNLPLWMELTRLQVWQLGSGGLAFLGLAVAYSRSLTAERTEQREARKDLYSREEDLFNYKI